jgi:hypothetical protein
LLTEIISDDQLKKLPSTSGFLVNIDYPTRDVKLHRIDCKYCNPGLSIGIKPSARYLTKPENSGIQKNAIKLIQKQKRSLAEKDTSIHFVLSATHRETGCSGLGTLWFLAPNLQ